MELFLVFSLEYLMKIDEQINKKINISKRTNHSIVVHLSRETKNGDFTLP